MPPKPWSSISLLPGSTKVHPPQGHAPFWLFRPKADGPGWLVGRYCELTKFATALRDNADLCDFLSTNQVRLGLRDSDVPPAGLTRQERYGTTVKGTDLNKDFTALRKNPSATPVHPSLTPAVNRKTDREENVKRFWASQTPQSHHIVEFNNLETLGVSHERGLAEMDYQQLPAVLLAAEFHQRYISAILKPAQRWSKAKLQLDLVATYRHLYTTRSPLFEPLWDISAVILREAGLTTI